MRNPWTSGRTEWPRSRDRELVGEDQKSEDHPFCENGSRQLVLCSSLVEGDGREKGCLQAVQMEMMEKQSVPERHMSQEPAQSQWGLENPFWRGRSSREGSYLTSAAQSTHRASPFGGEDLGGAIVVFPGNSSKHLTKENSCPSGWQDPIFVRCPS
ncbi:uncharacterized protein LOC144578713 [Callithrix jacchus]